MRLIAGSLIFCSLTCMIQAEQNQKVLNFTDAEKQQLTAAIGQLLAQTAPYFRNHQFPAVFASSGTTRDDLLSILKCCEMLKEFRDTGRTDLCTEDRNTPLHLCCALGLNELAIRLIESGAPLNVRSLEMRDGVSHESDTPLSWACARAMYAEDQAIGETEKLVRSLLEHGADPDLCGAGNLMPFTWTVLNARTKPGYEKLAMILLDAGSQDLKNRLDPLARSMAYRSLSKAIVSRLLQAGCDPNELLNESEQTPLYQLCNMEEDSARVLPILDLLIKAGADPNIPDSDGLTPLMACNNVETASFLLTHGADPSIRNKDGQNAAEFHQKNGYPDIAIAITAHQLKKMGSLR